MLKSDYSRIESWTGQESEGEGFSLSLKSDYSRIESSSDRCKEYESNVVKIRL